VQEQTAVARENARLYQELSAAYEKLYELDKLKDVFLSTVSHELRTPLTIVQGYVELLSEIGEAQLDPETRLTFISNIRRGCDELSLLLANIMDASVLQQLDTTTLRRIQINLQSVCQAVVDLFEPMIRQERRIVIVDIPVGASVYADETRFKQVLRNLITNALHYSSPGTSLRIVVMREFESERAMMRIAVIDQGSGVPLEQQSMIFERFVRLERDMHGDVRGSGLGLAICRQLVNAMGGTITVQSSGVQGEGSTFAFTLPIELL
jgi:signal transduction histidine kinase